MRTRAVSRALLLAAALATGACGTAPTAPAAPAAVRAAPADGPALVSGYMLSSGCGGSDGPHSDGPASDGSEREGLQD